MSRDGSRLFYFQIILVVFLAFSALWLLLIMAPSAYEAFFHPDPVGEGISKLRSPDPDVRWDAAADWDLLPDNSNDWLPWLSHCRIERALGSKMVCSGSPDPRIVEPLMAALKDTDSRVRRAAAIKLGKINDPRVVEPLIVALKDSDNEVRNDAEDSLGEIKDPRAAQLLVLSLRKTEVQDQVAGALAKIGAPAVDALVAASSDSDPMVRKGATYALRESEAATSVRVRDVLVAELKDTDAGVRNAATSAMEKIKDPRAVQALTEELHDSDPGVRRGAIDALVAIGGGNAAESLISELHDTDPLVREGAIDAVHKIGDARAVGSLVDLVNGGEPDEERKATRALLDIEKQRMAIAPPAGTRLQDHYTEGWWNLPIVLSYLVAIGFLGHFAVCFLISFTASNPIDLRGARRTVEPRLFSRKMRGWHAWRSLAVGLVPAAALSLLYPYTGDRWYFAREYGTVVDNCRASFVAQDDSAPETINGGKIDPDKGVLFKPGIILINPNGTFFDPQRWLPSNNSSEWRDDFFVPEDAYSFIPGSDHNYARPVHTCVVIEEHRNEDGVYRVEGATGSGGVTAYKTTYRVSAVDVDTGHLIARTWFDAEAAKSLTVSMDARGEDFSITDLTSGNQRLSVWIIAGLEGKARTF
jgi:HEAT repeat protein